MNHNLMYAPNKFFDLVAGNVRTVDNDTVEIDHELIIKELPLDTMNDDIISVDAFNRLYKLPIGSLPPNIPDIDFITDDLNEPNNILSIDSTNTINKSQASTNANGDIIISGKLDVSNIVSSTNTTMEKNTEFDDGFIINNGTVDFTNATDIIGISEYDQELNTYNDVQFEKIAIKGASFSPLVDTDVCINSTTIASFNMDASGGLYPSFTMSDRVNNGSGTSMGFGFFRDPSGEARASEIEFIEIAKRHSNKELIIAGSMSSQTVGTPLINVVQIASFSSDEIVLQRPLRLNSIPFQTVLIAQNILTINNLNVIEKSIAVIDTLGNYTSSGFMTVETPTLAPELITEWVLIKENNNLIKQVSLDDLYGQSLSSTGTPAFTSINIGSATPALDIKSQLQVSGPAGANVPTYPNQNLGGRVEIFNNSNPLPLTSISAYNDVDQALAFGTYGSVNAPWKKSSPSYFKYQRNNDIFGLYTNNTNAPTGSNATDKTLILYKNIGLSAAIEFHQPVFLLNTSVDPENVNDTYFITQNKVTNEILKRDYQPAYGTISGQGNIIETVINTVDVYIPLIGFVGSSDPLRNITIPPLGDKLEITNSGLYEINYNISIQPAALASTKLWDVAVFVNGNQTITSSVICAQTTDAQELTEISNSFMWNGTLGDVFDLRIRNRTNITNVVMRCATMTIKRLLN